MPLRRGFTLIEMMVSLAVIAVALVVVVSAFTITTKTARQAAAFSEVSAAIRQWETQIEEDLRGVDPAESILVLVGGTQAAGVTDDERQAGKHYRVLIGDASQAPAGYDPVRAALPDNATNPQYSDPRTDILMFFTKRAGVSQAPLPPTVALNVNNAREAQQAAYRDGARIAPMLVTYGHAAFGDTQITSTGYAWADAVRHIFTQQRTSLSPIAANKWQLIRRANLIEPPAGNSPNPWDYDPGQGVNTAEVFKRITRCQPYPANAPRFAGDVVGLDLAGLLKAPVFDPLFHPYEGLAIRANTNWIGPDALNAVNALLYPPDQSSRNNRHIGTILEEPPADLATNSALRLVPGCAWFQVEFLMPENPRNAIDNPDINTRTENFRWVDVTPGRTFIFVPDSAANRARIISDGATRAAASGNGSIARSRLADFAEITPESPNNTQDDVTDRRVRTWPYALRVTVRAFDPRGRMSDPIVRSIVHRFD